MKEIAANAQLRRLIHAFCWAGVSGLALTAVSPEVMAADTSASNTTEDNTLSEIVVTGIRASLQQSLDVKRDSFGIVDAISAEDIGKFPDANLASAMERIPGVTVSRAASTLGGSSTLGNATEITVRGFGPTFNETLYDGRPVPTAIGTRAFDFGSVGSDFVGQVDVLKTPDVTLSSGAIGATINIKYPKPLDHPGLKLAGSISGDDSTGQSSVRPNVGLLFSDTFVDDRFGVLADLAYAESKIRGDHINIQGWEGSTLAPSQLAGAAATASTAASIKDWFIQDYGIYQEHTDDKRVGGRLVLQARPVDGLEVTLDDNYSQEKIVQYQYGFSAWFNNGNLANVHQAADGTVTSFTQQNTPSDFQAQINQVDVKVNTVGLNVKWDVGEHSTYVLDVYHAEAKLNPDGLHGLDADIGYGNGPNGANIGIITPGGNNLPYPVNFGPGGNAANFSNPAYIGSHVLVENYNQNEDTINQFKLEGRWGDESLKFKYGLQITHDDFELRSFTDLPYTWQMYAGYGPPPQGSGGVFPIPAGLISTTFATGSNFINGWGNGANLPTGIIQANGTQIYNYLQGLNGVGQNVGACSNLAGATPCTGKYIMYPNLGGSQDITENTVSPYLSMSTTAKLFDMPLKINAGARFEDTHVTSAGLASLPTGALYVLSTDVTAYGFASTPAQAISTKSDYRYLLPNIDLSLNITDEVKARFDASRTLTRAPLNLLTPDLNVPAGQRVGALNATGGNPSLLPYLSDNVDLGAEWYFARNSYVSADVFVKEVTNFIVGGTLQQQINGVTLPNGSPAVFAVTSQVNGPSAEVRGLELALQYTFGDTGFGFLSNATFVGTNKPYNAYDTSTSGFAVTGLANSWNFIPFFDKYGVNVRVAINHRATYLDHFGQTQNNSQYGTEPTFVNAATYVDLSASYDFNSHVSAYFTAQNLSNEAYATHGRFPEQVLDVVDTGRMFTVGVRAKL